VDLSFLLFYKFIDYYTFIVPAANRLVQLSVSFRQKSKLVSVSLVICLVVIELMLLLNATTIQRVGAVEATGGIGVYWDSNCTKAVLSIDWETLKPESVKNVSVYIRNEANETVALSMKTENWDPSSAYTYLTLSWNYMGQPIGIGKVTKITLTLFISKQVSGITNFRFDIIIEAQTYVIKTIPGDADGDGYVYIKDLAILGKAWRTKIGDPNYDARADFNGDGVINLLDLAILGKNWRKRSP